MGSPIKVKQTIEVESEAIIINALELSEICKTPNIFEIENSTRGSEVKEKKKGLFDTEIHAIIGNINSRAQELRSKFNIQKEKEIDDNIKDMPFHKPQSEE